MISVPTSTGSVPTPTPAQQGPDEVYLMMAAAQMHKEGRLIQTAQQSIGPDEDIYNSLMRGEEPGSKLESGKSGSAEWEGQPNPDVSTGPTRYEPQKNDIQNLFRNRIRTQVGDKPLGQKI